MRPYLKIWLLLVVAFLIMSFLSEFGNIRLFDYRMAQMEFPKGSDLSLNRIVSDTTVDNSSDKKDLTDTPNKVILFIGDSMLENLSRRLGAYADKNGYELYAVIWYGSTTKKWADSRRVLEYKNKYNPGFIFICLGSNELFIENIIYERRKYVEKIISEIGNVPYVWIGPPNWKKDTGINFLIKSEVGENRYFESDKLHFGRAKDGRHPTKESAYKWMDEIILWVNNSDICSIKMDIPDKMINLPKETVILQPDE